MNRNRKQHTTPAFYLRNFGDPLKPKHVWRHDKDTKKVISASVKDIGWIKDLYKTLNIPGFNDEDAIDDLLRDNETITAPIVQRVASMSPLSNEERSNLALFGALMITRASMFRETFDEQFDESARQFLSKFAASSVNFGEGVAKALGADHGMTESEIEQFRKTLLDGKYSLEPNQNSWLAAVPTALKLGSHIFDLTWTFMIAKGEYSFITSDNPVFHNAPSRIPFENVGLVCDDIELTFPLTKGVALLGLRNDKSDMHVEVDDAVVLTVNRRTAYAAHRYIYASNKQDIDDQLLNCDLVCSLRETLVSVGD